MEKSKPSKKKAYFKNLTPEQRRDTKKSTTWRADFSKNQHMLDDEYSSEKKSFSKRGLQQPKSRLAELDEIWQETNGQDFETLVNAPLSIGGHFMFKSEKNLTMDPIIQDDLFSVDMKNLATIVQCIPFNQYVEVDDKYFTVDELTEIQNTVEQGKRAYNIMLESLRANEIKNSSTEMKLGDDRIDNSNSEKSVPSDKATNKPHTVPLNLEEDLDFLLSLEEPIRTDPVTNAQPSKNRLEESKTKAVPTVTKSIDLEKWLDLVLED